MSDNNFLQRPIGMDEHPGINDSNIRREEVNLDGGVFAIGANHPPSPVINDSVAQLLQDIEPQEEAAAIVEAPLVEPVAVARRPNRVSYSKKKLIGSKDLFLLEDHLASYNEVRDWTMEGRIDECPNRRRNGNTFLVTWNLQTSSPPLPNDFHVSHLQNRFDNSAHLKEQFKIGMELYVLRQPIETNTSPTRDVAAVTTPTPYLRRQQAVASLRTAASSASNSTGVERATRNNGNTIESDSEEEGSLVPEDDDFGWDDDNELMYYFQPDASEAADEEDTDPTNVNPQSYSKLLDDLRWSFEEVAAGDDLDATTRQLYNGPEGLRRGVAQRFKNPFDCFAECGGFTYEYVATLAANSNDYFDNHLKHKYNPSRWHKCQWHPITTEEMYKFLGIILKISLLNMDAGGYESSLIDTTIGTVERQLGPEKTPLPCPVALMKYQMNMFGVDKGDQIRVAGGGFATKSHFKKWYKRVLLGIFDCMLLNSLVAWNLSTESVSYRVKMRRFEFQMWVAESFLQFKDDTTPPTPEQIRDGRPRGRPPQPADAVRHSAVTPDTKHDKCIVCELESKIAMEAVGRAWLKRHVCKCSECGLTTHNFRMMAPLRKLQKFEEFEGMTCFEIAHSNIGKEIWRPMPGEAAPGRKRYSIDSNHAIVQRLKEMWHGQEE